MLADRRVGELSRRLEDWRPRIERAIFTRVQGVSNSTPVEDPEYQAGLRSAISAALRHCIDGIERNDSRLAPAPPELLAQARKAARNGVTLDTVLRRCCAGYSLLGDFVIQAAHDTASLRNADLQNALRAEAALFDRLLTAISDEYRHEMESRARSTEQRRAERVRRLLAGEPLDPGELRYELDAWHIGAVAFGAAADVAIRDVAVALDRRLLLVRGDEETLWVWLGGRRRISAREALQLAIPSWPAGASLAFGESEQGIDGWRLTHRQALAAMSVSRRGHRAISRYGEVSLVASMLQDEVLTKSLRDLYLSPLADERDGGRTLRQTLRAYFSAERNASSAAAALNVSRKTVANRLRTIEERLDRPLGSCAAEMEAALRLDELDASPAENSAR